MKILKFIITALFCIINSSSFAAFASFQVNGAAVTPSSFTPRWQALSMGAGGQITGIDYRSDGTTLIRTDTYGGYLYRSSGSCTNWGNIYAAPCWDQLVIYSGISPAPTYAANAGTYPTEAGAVELVACDSNTNVAYMFWEGFLYVTTNLKASPPNWYRTTLTTTAQPNGGGYKDHGKFIACDPFNPDIAIFGTPAGAFQTINGTASATGSTTTFTTLSTVLAPTSVSAVVAYDKTSSHPGNVTQRFMICSYGRGCYATTNGGGNLALTTGGPTTFLKLTDGGFGQFIIADGTTTGRIYTSSWSTFTMPDGAQAIAADPTSLNIGSNRLIASRVGSGDLMISTNNGASGWTGPNFNQTSSATGVQPGWLNTANQQSGGVLSLNTIDLIVDNSGNAWAAAGLGVWTTPAPVAVNATPWVANSVGIEQLVTNQILASPGISPVVAVWDKGFIRVENPDAFPSTYYNNSTSLNPIMTGAAIDYAPNQVGFISGIQTSNLDTTKTAFATSINGGASWNAWANQPSNNGLAFGNIVIGSSTNWLVHPACDSCAGGTRTPLYYTTNGGSTAFSTVTISGTPNFEVNQGYRFPLAADKVNAGSYCAVDTNLNFYNTTNIASGLTLVATSSAVDGGANADMLVSVPGQANTYMYTSAGNTSTHLWKNTNSCVAANWVSCDTGFTNVLAVGFGSTSTGTGFPIVYAWGSKSGVFGLYSSSNSCSTFSLLNVPASQQNWPRGTVDFISWVTGDPDTYGLVMVGYRGSGATYIHTADACPSVVWSGSILPGMTVSGTVSLTAQKFGLVPVTSVNFYVDGSLIGTQTSGSTSNGITTYTQSWNTASVGSGAHTLKVEAVGNGCTTTGNSKSIPVTK